MVKGFWIFFVYKVLEKIDLCAYSFQKWVHVEEILMKLYSCFNKKWWVIEKSWKKSAIASKKEFHSEPIYNENYQKTKIKFYKGKMKTNEHNNKKDQEASEYTCLSVISINSVYGKDKNYFPQLFLEEFKYVNMLLKKKRCQSLLLTT